MAATGVPPGDDMIALAFVAAAAAAVALTFGGGWVEVCYIIVLLKES